MVSRFHSSKIEKVNESALFGRSAIFNGSVQR